MRFFIIALCFFLLNSFKMDDEQWSKSIINKCNTAKDIGYLTNEEKAVIFYINIVRVNPKLFTQTYLKTYLDTASIKQTDYLKSLIAELNSMKPLGIVEPQFDLYEVAKKHATEMGAQGKTGHISLNGESYEARANAISRRYKKVMENCQYGYSDGLSIVIDLLIDEDIADLSHRKALLNKDIRYIGTAIKKHKVYRYNCVMEMSYDLKH